MLWKRTSNRQINECEESFLVWELFFEKILQNMDSFVFVTGADGRIVFANDMFLRSFNVSQDQSEGRDWIEVVIPDEYHSELESAYREIKRRKILGKLTSNANVKDGGKKKVLWLIVPLKSSRKDYYFFMGKPAAGENPQGVRVHELGPEELRKLYSRFIKDIFNASMKAEPDTASHAERVMRFSIRVARRMGLSGKSIENLKAAALLHDLGKLAVDQKVLFKKGRLTAEEYEKIKKHPFWAAEVVKMIYFLHDIVPIMGSHHESFDGEGYPECMKGRDIPIESRILSIADVFEALIADRPYRKGYPREKAIELIEMEKGRKFDPEVTDVFLEMLREGEIE